MPLSQEFRLEWLFHIIRMNVSHVTHIYLAITYYESCFLMIIHCLIDWIS